jgi:hypothetical protein
MKPRRATLPRSKSMPNILELLGKDSNIPDKGNFSESSSPSSAIKQLVSHNPSLPDLFDSKEASQLLDQMVMSIADRIEKHKTKLYGTETKEDVNTVILNWTEKEIKKACLNLFNELPEFFSFASKKTDEDKPKNLIVYYPGEVLQSLIALANQLDDLYHTDKIAFTPNTQKRKKPTQRLTSVKSGVSEDFKVNGANLLITNCCGFDSALTLKKLEQLLEDYFSSNINVNKVFLFISDPSQRTQWEKILEQISLSYPVVYNWKEKVEIFTPDTLKHLNSYRQAKENITKLLFGTDAEAVTKLITAMCNDTVALIVRDIKRKIDE